MIFFQVLNTTLSYFFLLQTLDKWKTSQHIKSVVKIVKNVKKYLE